MRAALKIAGTVALLWAGCTEAPPGAPSAPAPREVARAAEPLAVTRAVVNSVRGEVSIKRADGDSWISASEHMQLFENDKLRTSRGASAEVRFTSGSVLKVGEDALVGIAETQPLPGTTRSDVTVLRGRIDAELEDPGAQSLTVSTPSAVVRAGREIVFQ